MKKTTTMLLLAALMPVLCQAQESPATPTPAKLFVAAAKDAKTVAEVQALERQYAADSGSWTPAEQWPALCGLFQAYYRTMPGDPSGACSVLTRYTPDWETSTHPAVGVYYHYTTVAPAWNTLRTDLRAAQSAAQLDQVLAAYFGTNLFPERLARDSRDFSLPTIAKDIADAARRVGHPDAVAFSLAYYRIVSMQSGQAVDLSVQAVAAALKAADFGLGRANAWIDSQNTGEPAVAFTAKERATPEVMARVPAVAAAVLADTAAALETAKANYRSAQDSAQIDKAIYGIANVLKAHDLNLARANAWIEAQKNGQAFDLTLNPAK